MKKKMSIFAVVAGMVGIALADVPIAVSYAFEDAAFQAATRLNANSRVSSMATNVAFAKLWYKEGAKAQGASENEAIVFETALAATPGSLHFVVHAGHDVDWKLIDEIFAQADNFSSWDPKTCPKLKKLKLCDAILTAHLIGIYNDSATHSLSVRLALRLIHVATAEEIWSGVVEGAYSDVGPDNEKVSPQWRKALESCAADAVSKLPPSLDGYGVLILPIEGQGGKAMGQVFLNALTAAGRQDRIRVYDLPTGNAADRMLGRFLRERAGTGIAIDDSVLKRIEKVSGSDGIKMDKLALMTGNMSVVNEDPKWQLDSSGLPVDFIGGQVAAASAARKRYEITADIKFRDIKEHFRLIAAIGAAGAYEPPLPTPPPRSPFDNFLELIGIDKKSFLKISVGVIAALLVLMVAVRIFKTLCRAR